MLIQIHSAIKSTGKALGLLFALILLSQCEKYDLIYEIPDDEKFTFVEGDRLTYSCSDGSIDTFYVTAVSYYTETGVVTEGGSWFGGKTDSYDYSSETLKIDIQALNHAWNPFVEVSDDYSPCYVLFFWAELSPYGTDLFSSIDIECSGGQGNSFINAGSWEKYPTRTFNGKLYHDVYHYESLWTNPEEESGMRFNIYWNMKQGIIRFEGISETPELSEIYWDLMGKV